MNHEFQKSRCLTFRLILLISLCMTIVLHTGCSQRKITAGSPAKDSSSLGTRVAREATTQIGKPYLTGGASPQRGFDCSGLVYWAYGRHGIQIPRTTAGQAKTGSAVSRSRLMPGDIVVFSEPSSPNKLHTGIFIGNNSFVHSPNSRSSVRTDSIDAAHWRRAFINGRRVVSSQRR